MGVREDLARAEAVARAEALIRYYTDVRDNYEARRQLLDAQLEPLLRLSRQLEDDHANAEERIASARALLDKRTTEASHGDKLDQLRRLREQVGKLETYVKDHGVTEDQIDQIG